MPTAAPPDDCATRVTDLRLLAGGGQGLPTLRAHPAPTRHGANGISRFWFP